MKKLVALTPLVGRRKIGEKLRFNSDAYSDSNVAYLHRQVIQINFEITAHQGSSSSAGAGCWLEFTAASSPTSFCEPCLTIGFDNVCSGRG